MSIDELIALYAKKWSAFGFTVNGQGKLVLSNRQKWVDEEAKLRTLAAVFDTKAYDPKSKLYVAGIANAKEIDRMNEVLEPVGCMYDAYQKNPVFLLQHNHSLPVGCVSMLKAEDNGMHFEGWVGDPAAAPLTRTQEDARSLVAQRIIKAVSVGFIPHEIRYPTYNERGDIVEPAKIEKWEMLELSLVAVPCNAGALFDLKGDPVAPAKQVWSFPTLGKDGRLEISSKSSEENMDPKELKALLEGLSTTMKDVATVMNGVKDGQAELLKSVNGLSESVKGKNPPKDDDEEEDEDMKAVKAQLAALDGAVKAVQAEQADILKTLTALVEKAA